MMYLEILASYLMCRKLKKVENAVVNHYETLTCKHFIRKRIFISTIQRLSLFCSFQIELSVGTFSIVIWEK